MSGSKKFSSKIASLENELLSVRHELALLQSSRSHRIAKFSRQLLSTSLSELPKTLKQFPDLLIKHSIPAPEMLNEDVDIFSPLTNSLPLFRFPNINIGYIGNGDSRTLLAFAQTCNTTPLRSTHAHELMSYNALQLVVLEIESYKKEHHLTLIQDAIRHEARLLVIASRDQITPKELTELNPIIHTVGLSSDSSIKPFANIYAINQKTPPRTPASSEGFIVINSAEDIAHIKYDKISILSSSFIEEIDQHDNHEAASAILDRLAAYSPILIEGKAPEWLPSSIKNLTSTSDREAALTKLSNPYEAERYAITCGRQTVIEHNPLTVVSKILLDIGLIDTPPEPPRVSVVLSMRRPQFLQQILNQLDKQTLRPHEVILMLHGVPEEEKIQAEETIELSDLVIKHEFVPESVLFGDVLNMAIDKAEGEFVTKVDDDDYYGENHLLDLYAAHLSSRADFVGKWNHWVYIQADDETISWTPEESCKYVRHIPGGTLFGKTSTFREIKFGKVRRAIDSELYRRAIKRGATLYSTHRYNYIRVRHDDHTYTATNADFKSRSDGNHIAGLPLDELTV